MFTLCQQLTHPDHDVCLLKTWKWKGNLNPVHCSCYYIATIFCSIVSDSSIRMHSKNHKHNVSALCCYFWSGNIFKMWNFFVLFFHCPSFQEMCNFKIVCLLQRLSNGSTNGWTIKRWGNKFNLPKRKQSTVLIHIVDIAVHLK